MEQNYQFTYIGKSADCVIILYDEVTGAVKDKIPFDENNRIGKVNRLTLPLARIGKKCIYQFYDGDKRYPDQKGRLFFVAKKYGEVKGTEDYYSVLDIPEFDWQDSVNPRTPYEDSLIYCMHVRGFSRHVSSGVRARGTFAGVIEKIPYLMSLGVTCLELQPIYEFIEKVKNPHNWMNDVQEASLLNYWGYKEGYYFAPKTGYAKGNAIIECKEMIRELHKNGIEVVLQFYFPSDFNPMGIPEILRFWVEEYHVDGFHLIGENLPGELIARDPILSETKLWYYQLDTERIYGKNEIPDRKNLGLLRDDYMYDLRRFLKGEEGMTGAVMYHLRAVPLMTGRIHYLTTYWGFTLMDMVSYDFKHNEANGEDNHDGTDYNCSWNCGEEGFSRKKRIQSLRLTQIKNALTLLFFTQSTPRIFMGDEFGNSQKGNNNPYCQDNETTWLNWKNLEKNHEIADYFRKMVMFRKENKVLHMGQEPKMMDMLSCGYPDMSYHGMTAWRPQMEYSSRQLGVMYCGEYGKSRDAGTSGNDFIYLAINMHWESHSLALPRLPKGKEWQKAYSTCNNMDNAAFTQDVAMITPKTIAVFTSADVKYEEKQEVEPKENEPNLETL